DQRSQTQIAALYLLIADLQAGKLITTDELRSQLEAIAHEIQASLTETDIMPNPQDLPAPDSPSVPLESFEDEALEAVTLQPEDEGDDMPTVILPMQLFSLEDAGKTDIGRTRDHNEDCFGIDTTITKTQTPPGRTVQAQGLYILCDGMGGHASGEVASQLAVDTLRRYFRDHWPAADAANPSGLPPLATIREAVQLANQAIYDVNQQNARSGSGRMGTTMVVLLIQDTEAAVAHVGDSRLYRYSRKAGLKQITIDHEVGQREIQRGIEATIAYSRPDAYQLTQALGPRDENFISPDVQFFELNEDMVLILASDGLTDNDLLETHCATHIEPLISSMTNLEQGVNQLIELANQYNGHDNITAIAIRAKVRPNLEQLW
ncbi:MAG: serine/threonine phosphatase, partial [Phormidesmis sp. CAN_BIN36]|nr:serine/threonine phosphatase [Phormidesmis sp. CAN_BIN36]